jgi:hypothetical protein
VISNSRTIALHVEYLARSQTALYRIGKFVRRHRTGVAASIVAGLLLIGSVSYAVWRQEQALRETQRALSMQTFMSSLFTIANSQYSGKPIMSVNEFLNVGIKVLPLYIQILPIFAWLKPSAIVIGEWRYGGCAESFCGERTYRTYGWG